MSDLVSDLKKIVKGDVENDDKTLRTFSHDASIFDVKPKVVVFPKNASDIEALVKYVAENKKKDSSLSLTGRSAGTDMGGGPLNESIIVNFQKYFTHIKSIKDKVGTVEPGVFYRDFEVETLKQNLIFPSYPASRGICAMGGILNNNSGGEKSLQYGTTEKYIRRVKVVLSDGKTYEFKSLNEAELNMKMRKNDFEGEIYNKMYKLITDNYEDITRAKPDVTKNSAGYFLWNILDREKKTFDLTQLWTGAQGTLGLLLEGDLELVPVHEHIGMLIIYLRDMAHLGQIVNEVLTLKPESF